MFTGIIEEQGIVASVIKGSQSAKLSISAGKVWLGLKLGESVAVNGACLTVVDIRRNFVTFDLSSESLKNTTLGELRIGDKVNLERAMLLSSRVGGHLITGHVDGIGEIRDKRNTGDGFELYLSIPSDLLRYLIPRGSLSVDGVSLTIADLRDGLVKLAVIPHTAKTTNLVQRSAGDKVNIEVDVLSKYIEKHLHGELKTIDQDTLTRMGFMPMGWIDN